MFALVAGKAHIGQTLGEFRCLHTEGRVTLTDGLLAAAVLIGLALNAAASWWLADWLAALDNRLLRPREADSALAGN